MTTRRIRLVVIGTLGLGLALSQQACRTIGATGAAPTAASPPAVSSPSPATASPSSLPDSSDSGSGGGKTEAKGCRNDDLDVTVTLQPERDKASRGLVAVTNTGDAPCALEGRAIISLSNAAGETVDVPTEEVDQPGEPVAITLRPGRSAFQGIKWTPCDKGSSTCPAGNGLRFNVQASTDGPPADLDGFPAPEKTDITMKSLQLGTLQPLTQGVVAW